MHMHGLVARDKAKMLYEVLHMQKVYVVHQHDC